MTRIVEATVLSIHPNRKGIPGCYDVTVRAPGFGTLEVEAVDGASIAEGDVRQLRVEIALGGLIRRDDRANLDQM